MEKWAGSLAVVTGASAGVGAAISTELVKAGINVVGIGRRVEKIDELSESLADAPAKLHSLYCDLSDEQEILNAFKWIEETLGPISIMINNAGVLHLTTLREADVDKLRDTFKVNVLAYCICQREAIKSMKTNEIDGIIINISSVMGLKVPDIDSLDLVGQNLYPATKHAIHSISDTLRLELRKESSKIRVTIVSPGAVASELRREFSESELNERPMMKCEDVAKTVIYILSTPPNVQIQDIVIRPIWESI
ncbi:farnesol dehydrogenase-like [Photinus pyralis]|uniref:farnesol dehydrogenase-like n=1 Tax=Photinus pyralis TaxID=7054 RepID=UPI00126734FE|nr:farnesol dehydrogenase-like [Photinus pyralis]